MVEAGASTVGLVVRAKRQSRTGNLRGFNPALFQLSLRGVCPARSSVQGCVNGIPHKWVVRASNPLRCDFTGRARSQSDHPCVTRTGFEPVPSWVKTRGTDRYSNEPNVGVILAALAQHSTLSSVEYGRYYDADYSVV